MHKEEIKAAIRMAFGSVTAFERAKNLPPESVSDVLRGRAVRQTEDAIAKFMKVAAAELFPRRRRFGGAQHTSGKPDVHRLNRGAA